MVTDWNPETERVAELVEDEDAARGWRNPTTGEVVVRRPLLEDDSNLPEYGVYHYLRVSERGRGTNRDLLCRGEDEETLDSQVAEWIKESDTPEDPGRFDTALSPEQIRRREIVHVNSLRDWAHRVGAKYYIGEKIGNRKESSGEVAFFSGSTRRGEGSYVALASETGPRGREFISVGVEPDGYYTATVDSKSSGNKSFRALEIESPTVEYDGTEIHVTYRSGDTAKVVANTDCPNEYIGED